LKISNGTPELFPFSLPSRIPDDNIPMADKETLSDIAGVRTVGQLCVFWMRKGVKIKQYNF